MPPALPVVLAMALSVFALTAHAQAARAPVTKNPHLKKIASDYNNLDYEAAIARIPKAEKFPQNKEQDRLWLDLMSGVLHYSMNDAASSEAAFKRALERVPDATLPIENPSYTLSQRFDALRKTYLAKVKTSPQAAPGAASAPSKLTKLKLLAMLRDLEAQGARWAKGPLPGPLAAAFRSLHDQAIQAQSLEERQALAATINTWLRLLSSGDVAGVNALVAETVPARPGESGQGKSLPDASLAAGSDPLRNAISVTVLNERIRRMKEWLIVKSEKGRTPQLDKLLGRLNEIFRLLETAPTAHERMRVAIELDVFEVQMARHVGWPIQGSAPQAISVDKE